MTIVYLSKITYATDKPDDFHGKTVIGETFLNFAEIPSSGRETRNGLQGSRYVAKIPACLSELTNAVSAARASLSTTEPPLATVGVATARQTPPMRRMS